MLGIGRGRVGGRFAGVGVERGDGVRGEGGEVVFVSPVCVDGRGRVVALRRMVV